MAVDIVSQFLYTRFSLSLTNLAALKLFRRGVREFAVLPVRVTFKRKYVYFFYLNLDPVFAFTD